MPKIDVREAALSLARDRTTRHLVMGLGLAAGVVAASAILGWLNAPKEEEPELYEAWETPEGKKTLVPAKPVLAAAWTPVFLALTLSGLRIWTAPKSPARTQALTLWGFVQALNAVWMALGPRRLGGGVAATTAAIGATGAYVWRAKRVEAAPTVH